MTIKIGIIGVGNCASSLYQGLFYYQKNTINQGLMKKNIGNYEVKDIEVVCAFDIDSRKVGLNLKDALKQNPNCTPNYYNEVDDGPIVKMGPVLDGVANHMTKQNVNKCFKISDKTADNVVEILQSSKTDILINYLPVGSQSATEFYANCCLEAKVCFLNCIPVFIASDPIWEKKFIEAKLPIIGDDMKSQFGASILSQMLQELAFERGVNVKAHIQRNIGGNTDFLNMSDSNRIKSKKISKENVIKSQHTIHNIDLKETFIHAGPSEYISYYGDNKIANIHLDMEGFLGSPITLDAQLSVIDSPNSAGVVIDAIRYLMVAKELGIVGSLRGPSAFTQKSPPKQMSMNDAIQECELLSNRKLSNIMIENNN